MKNSFFLWKFLELWHFICWEVYSRPWLNCGKMPRIWWKILIVRTLNVKIATQNDSVKHATNTAKQCNDGRRTYLEISKANIRENKNERTRLRWTKGKRCDGVCGGVAAGRDTEGRRGADKTDPKLTEKTTSKTTWQKRTSLTSSWSTRSLGDPFHNKIKFIANIYHRKVTLTPREIPLN